MATIETERSSVDVSRQSVNVTGAADTIEVEFSSTGNVCLWAWRDGDIVANVILGGEEAQELFTTLLAKCITHRALVRLIKGE